jgi:hypothetical protein
MNIKGIIRSLIEEKITEATELDHSRYMRVHGKKAKGDGNWMFTSKEMGEPKDGEMVTVSGSLSTAAKEAAKKLKTNRVYVMEEVELDEALDKDYAGMLGKFKKAVDKAEEAKSKGDKEKMSKHLEDARNRLFGMKSTDSAKLKTTDHYDRYNKMKGMKEEADFKVSVEGLPDMYVKGKSSSEVKANLRKVIKKPDAIQSIDRVMPSELKKIFRDKAAGKEEIEESLEEDKSADYERVRALMPSSMPVDKWIPIKNGFEAIVSSKGSYNLRRKVKMAGEVRYEKFSLTRSGGLKSLGFSKMEESLDEVAIIKNGRKFSNVKFFETEKGANDFLEKNPDFGVIQADNGGVYIAKNTNKGTPVK